MDVLPTICVHRLRLSGVLLLRTSSSELSRDIHKIGEHFPRMGGATVLKVGDNFASGASKNFFDPHFLASGGTKILLR